MSNAVLLATYNGARFVEEQLRSIAAQTVGVIDVYASDDGSSDGTQDLLADWSRRWDKGRFEIYDGPRAGNPAENFRTLVLRISDRYDFVAYADQDDVWLPEKLERAAERLAPLDDRPAISCCRTRLIDKEGKPFGYSLYFPRPPSFANALVQSLAGGNTMVMNARAFEIVRKSLERTPCGSHDWWTYQIVTGAGGQMLYSAEPDTLYRQHDANVVGANPGLLAAIGRLPELFGGRFRSWNEENINALNQCADLLTVSNLETLGRFMVAHRGTLIERLRGLRASGIYRQTRRGQIALWTACMLGLI